MLSHWSRSDRDAWDAGIAWFLEQAVAPDMDADPLQVDAVRDDHLHAVNGTAENDYILQLMQSSLRIAERITQRTLLPTGLVQVMDRFPLGDIVLPRPPLIELGSIVYIDSDGVEQTLATSAYETSIPSGPTAARGRIHPVYGTCWPQTRCQRDSVRVTFTAGYPLDDESDFATVPEDINQGRLLVIGEFYKQRSESVHAFNQNPALIRARDLWLGYRVF